MIVLERVSLEVTNKCRKGCSFCYNSSSKDGQSLWSAKEIVSFATSCADGGVKAISLGGGEPLEFPPIFDVLTELRGRLFRSMTTNGLLLEGSTYDRLIAAQPDKVHISIHFTDHKQEVGRVIRQARQLAEDGIRSGINLLVRRSKLESARAAAREIADAGIDPSRIVYLPMRKEDTPTPREVASVAGDRPFQSMSCLDGCAKSPRFCSVGWDKSVAWCSYTSARAFLPDLTYESLRCTLEDLELEDCAHGLVQLARG